MNPKKIISQTKYTLTKQYPHILLSSSRPKYIYKEMHNDLE